MIRSQLSRIIGNQGDLVGSVMQNKFDELRSWVAFNIELSGNDGPDHLNIFPGDMSFIRTGMDGDALGTKALTVDGCFDYVGNVAAPCIAERGDLVDVDTESGHGIDFGQN